MNEARILVEAGMHDNFLSNFRARHMDMNLSSAEKLVAAMKRLNKLPMGDPVRRGTK